MTEYRFAVYGDAARFTGIRRSYNTSDSSDVIWGVLKTKQRECNMSLQAIAPCKETVSSVGYCICYDNSALW